MSEQKIAWYTDYTVQKDDTRDSIARRAYGNAKKWNLIEDANKGELANLRGRDLPPGMKLSIPDDGGHIHPPAGGGDIHPVGN